MLCRHCSLWLYECRHRGLSTVSREPVTRRKPVMATPTIVLALPILILAVTQGRCCENSTQLETWTSRKIETYRMVTHQLKIRKMMATYNETKNWRTLRTSLEAILNPDADAYRQLQQVDYSEHEPMWAIGGAGYEDLAVVLVAGGDGANMADYDRCTLLHGAAHQGRARLVEMLLDHGADAEAVAIGNTAITLATAVGSLEVVKLLKERGADLDSVDSNGDTGLHRASSRGSMDIVRYLVEAGANTAATNKAGLTPYDYVIASENTPVSQYLSQFPH